ncbi:FtsW/RodA/SpoVE family cell cycle protein [Aerococcaceae bacterium INB8]|uniref:Probable peptidoglycan glycosyltransferase FtsW n=1 Tax=Ruoffia halotolerans TaxID=2748684 RepID=A0A839A4G7_9LACT|nr:FtsW/RodA/SpoVE family cell cycle protein [Ruoffia halotolerans]MBA5728862.1 FtsW/RodA/SpoVE family cell cycle protein [Ruoffia halotolerans]
MANNEEHHDASKSMRLKNLFKELFSKKEMAQNFRLIDKSIVLITTLLVVIGLISVFSATMYDNPMSAITTQSLSVVIGVIIIGIMVVVPFELFKNIKLILIMMVILIFLLLYTLATQESVWGATSWFVVFGVSFQPSEFVKVIGILVISWLIKYYDREVILTNQKLPSWFNVNNVAIATLVVSCVLIFLQPDLGMLIILSATLGLIFLLTKGSLKWNIIAYSVLFVGYLLLTIIGRQFGDWLVSKDFHMFERIASFIDPFRYSSDSGYQIIQGLMAFSRGGWFGMGLGEGVSKQGALPVIESDYILANIAEELGLIGVLVVVGLLFSLIVIIYQRAAASTELYRKSVLIGVASLLLVQTVINIGGVVSILPLTGVTLPFISYGGTSMIAMLSAIGLALRMIIEEGKEPNINLVYSKRKGE